jgi:diguanylate cyclase (GGDEF)-like protein/putative nucleotidyltransferase with HDIG domain
MTNADPAAAVRRIPEQPPEPADLPLPARVYLGLVLGAATLAAIAAHGLSAATFRSHGITWMILAAAATVAHAFPVKSPRNQMFHTSQAFMLAAALLLPAETLVLIAVVVSLPEWLKERYPWYIQSFNISNYALDMLAAWGAARLLLEGRGLDGVSPFRQGAAVLAACAAFVVANHVLLGLILHLGRGHALRDTLFPLESTSIDFGLATLGGGLALFWSWNPWLIPIALTPLILVHRSLAVPQLQEEARIDSKTGLFNARYFAGALEEELARSARFDRPASLIMADLDLLREVNNSYGHLAGDAVLKAIADIFRSKLRNYDIPARFGGEEFSILLPETGPEHALEIAERIRRAVADCHLRVDTSDNPIHVTVSIGVASFPKDASDANELVHQADLAVYRAKLQGRNRVQAATREPSLVQVGRSARLIAAPEPGAHAAPVPAPRAAPVERTEERRRARPRNVRGPRLVNLSGRMSGLVAAVSMAGIGAGVAGVVLGGATDVVGLAAIVLLVGAGQALALEFDDLDGSISVSAVGALAGVALFGARAALPLALAAALVAWSSQRSSPHQVIFNVGSLSLASLAAAAVFARAGSLGGDVHRVAVAAIGVVGGGVYFVVNMGLVSLALAFEGRERWRVVFRERFAWLSPHYLVYGFIGGVIAVAYDAVGLLALGVFAVPLLLMRKTQEAYLKHTQHSARKLRQAAETIQTQNVSLEHANRLLRERSTAAMESLSATVDARDSYTAGHSRRVQQLALAIGCELGLSQPELDLLGHAALFHDIGKLAIPDAVLLKPSSLTPVEWELMQRHAEEGARIIGRLGFLQDAVPAIRHHHERWDGTGYPDQLRGEETPLGARIIHVADALDSMLTTRIYQAARPAEEALEELRRNAGTQFCPRTVAALERILPLETILGEARHAAPQEAAGSRADARAAAL